MASHGFRIYASVEPILNLTDEGDNQISIAGGGFLQLSSHLLLNAFYQFTATETGPDFHFPGIGLLITLSPFKSPPPPDAETKKTPGPTGHALPSSSPPLTSRISLS
ncbi:MAG: hypothetical protein AAFU79_09130 [Myxococcota bacterium]